MTVPGTMRPTPGDVAADVRYPHNGNVWTGSYDNGTKRLRRYDTRTRVPSSFAGLNTSAMARSTRTHTNRADQYHSPTMPYRRFSLSATVTPRSSRKAEPVRLAAIAENSTTSHVNVGTPVAATDARHQRHPRIQPVGNRRNILHGRIHQRADPDEVRSQLRPRNGQTETLRGRSL